MGDDGKKIVWILGAGFSRSLGAPLLDELLTVRSAERVQAAYRGKEFLGPDNLRGVAVLCEAGIEEKQWKNAEELIERLHLAESSDSARQILCAYCSTSPRVKAQRVLFDGKDEEIALLRRNAGRLLAANICLFLKDADPELERWSPYIAWAKDLQPKDAIITFNYDRVIEILKDKREGGIVVPIPEHLSDTEGRPVALKMHGSVDWLLDAGSIREAEGAGTEGGLEDWREAALHCDPRRMALGVPGPAKYRMTKGKDGADGPLTAIWNRAGEEIASADAVVMVGYRMPETDAYSKQWLIGELRGRIEGNPPRSLPKKNLLVHTVLGPDPEHPHAKRLKGLLKMVVPNHLQHREWPLGAEDFLGLVKRDELLRPPDRQVVTYHWEP